MVCLYEGEWPSLGILLSWQVRLYPRADRERVSREGGLHFSERERERERERRRFAYEGEWPSLGIMLSWQVRLFSRAELVPQSGAEGGDCD